MFVSLASDGAIAGAAIFSMRALTPSTPVALPSLTRDNDKYNLTFFGRSFVKVFI